MPQSLARVIIHSLFSTKDRYPFLSDPDVRDQMHQYLGGIAKEIGCLPIRVGGVSDHVHLLTTLGRTVTISGFVKEVKRVSTNWIKQQDGYEKFSWQAGYAVFFVSPGDVDGVQQYIDNQAEHHSKKSFQEELRELFKDHAVEFDERYVWD